MCNITEWYLCIVMGSVDVVDCTMLCRCMLYVVVFCLLCCIIYTVNSVWYVLVYFVSYHYSLSSCSAVRCLLTISLLVVFILLLFVRRTNLLYIIKIIILKKLP